MSDPINQHYVPQFLLRKFCNPRDKIFVFDKEKNRSFETNPRNIAAEREFYNFSREGIEFSLEKPISEIESAAGALFDKIIENNSLSILTEANCVTISLYMAIQHLRGPRVRRDHEIIANSLRERFGDSPEGQSLLEREWPSGEDHAKNFAIHFIANQVHNHIPFFLNKTWFLFKAPERSPFCISDNPVVLHNNNDYGPYGNLGLGVKGIQITYPISPSFALGFYCISIEQDFRNELKKFNNLKDKISELNEKERSAIEFIENFLHVAETGTPLCLNNENILHLNSLQVGCSNRFVFSSSDDFTLARDMVAKGHTGWGNIKVN